MTEYELTAIIQEANSQYAVFYGHVSIVDFSQHWIFVGTGIVFNLSLWAIWLATSAMLLGWKQNLGHAATQPNSVNCMKRFRILNLIHPVTACGILVLIALFALIQSSPKFRYFDGGATNYRHQKVYGWPRAILIRTTTKSLLKANVPPTNSTTLTFVNEWNVLNTCVNWIAFCMVVGFIAFCTEIWLRRCVSGMNPPQSSENKTFHPSDGG